MEYTVSLMKDCGYTETCHPLAVGVGYSVAKSIKRHYEKMINKLGLFYEPTQTGFYVMVVDRKYCLNHADFERESGTGLARMNEILADWDSRGVKDATAEPEWEEYEWLLGCEAELEMMWKGEECYV